MDRYVTIDAMAAGGQLMYDERPFPSTIDLEVRVGADDEHSYTKRVVYRALVPGIELPQVVYNDMSRWLSEAARLKATDLDQNYARRLWSPDQPPGPSPAAEVFGPAE
jgi:hypothetical protein